MAKNNLLTIASASGATVADDNSWASSAIRLLGFQNGIVDAPSFNKAYRQGAFGSAMLGQALVNYGLVDANDDGDVPGFLIKFRAAMAAMLAGVAYGQDTSTTANAIVVALDPAPPAPITAFRNLYVRVANTNTGPVTIALNALGSKPATRHNGLPLAAGDLPGGQIAHFEFDPVLGQWALGGLGAAEVPRIATNTTLFVRTDGSDGNDGSANDAAHAFQTPAAAIAYGLSRFSLVSGALTIQLGLQGTYPAPGVIPATVGTLAIFGDPNNPGAYILNGSPTVSPIFVQGVVNATGVTFTNNSPGSATCTASANGFLTLRFCQVQTTVTASAHFAAGNTGIVAISSVCSILTGATNAFAAVTSGNIQINAPINLVNTPGFPSAFAYATSNGSIGVASGVTFTGTGASGPRYLVSLNGTINTGGGGPNFFPGSSAGSNADGTGAYA